MSDYDRIGAVASKPKQSAYGDCLEFLQLSDTEWAALLSSAGNARILPVQVSEVRSGAVPVPRFWWHILRTYWMGTQTKSKRFHKKLKRLGVSAREPSKTVVHSASLDPSDRVAKAMAILNLSGDTGYSEEVIPSVGERH
ncbi:hypothetical protein [Ponticaulis sp.]|uniref:hypothetical protein n=1 Tax=Ponticaulis sp. TaxID=2020902 RepID=UPI000B720379|nr:hypothetical protein [Ponticaulis sp.]MAI91603.1 hypothetical protein [Ponticaulis sp.]OUX97557.1 MAG: hypothetical protein CBB65_14275 [Hyphomonadaceae bacterium TMED5]|tara:strand:+ start:75601 stop:76020 length:420 start_codon:yes stop_codon:yes gene_type:complete